MGRPAARARTRLGAGREPLRELIFRFQRCKTQSGNRKPRVTMAVNSTSTHTHTHTHTRASGKWSWSRTGFWLPRVFACTRNSSPECARVRLALHTRALRKPATNSRWTSVGKHQSERVAGRDLSGFFANPREPDIYILIKEYIYLKL